jgi:hypothetical protein
MPGRVLNFLEFSDKYSGGGDDISLDDIKNSSSNFEEAFDDDTYDQPEIKANRPVSGEYESTPDQPTGTATQFQQEMPEGMEAPDEPELPSQVESNLDTNKSEEDEESEEEEETEDEESEEESGNPESDAKVEEGITLIKGFSQFINEEFESDDPSHYEDDDYQEEADDCPDCGESPISNEYGYSCGCNM